MDELRHPDDERLSALAGADADALADTSLRRHVDGCTRCAGLVGDLQRLRAALGELPDLVSPRPLRLLPPVPEERPAVGWIRRAFAPAFAAGALMVVIGIIGLAGGGGATLFSSAALNDQRGAGEQAPAAASAAASMATVEGPLPGPETPSAPPDQGGLDLIHGSVPPSVSAAPVATPTSAPSPTATGERSVASSQPGASFAGAAGSGPNPALLVLLGGLALIGGALVLRFVVVPRAW